MDKDGPELNPDDPTRPTAAAVFSREAFAERVYGVTGAGFRIGESLVRALAELGARVLLVDIDERNLSRVERNLRDAGADVRSVLGDVGERATIERAVDTAYQAWGRVDGWVNNAPANPRAGILEQTDEQVERAWQVNVEAARRAVQRLVPIMREQRSGAIVNVSSILAHQTRGWDATYAGTKAALEALTRAWAVELGELGIRVNCVRPGAIGWRHDYPDTEIGRLRRQMHEARIRASEPRQAPTLPSDVANAMLYLLSDAAAAITGVVLPVDGGASVEFRHNADNPGRLQARREMMELRQRIAELEDPNTRPNSRPNSG